MWRPRIIHTVLGVIEQKDELKEREATDRAAAESAFLKLYAEAWLPRFESGALSFERIAVGGRPLQVTLDEQKEAMIHQRMMELLSLVQPRVFSKVMPGKIIELFKLGDSSSNLGVKTADIVDGFFSFLGFTRLSSAQIVAKAVAVGVQDANFGYASAGALSLGADGKYQVARDKVRIGVPVSEDEIDLESGFIMLPRATPVPAPAPTPPGGPETPQPEGGPIPQPPGSPAPTPPGAPAPAAETTVAFSFSANRNQLFSAWNALANLADMSGTVSVSVHA